MEHSELKQELLQHRKRLAYIGYEEKPIGTQFLSLRNTSIKEFNFSHHELDNSIFDTVEFYKCCFTDITGRSSTIFGPSKITDCLITRSNIHFCFQDTLFLKCKFENCTITSIIETCIFKDCEFYNCRFIDSVLRNTLFEDCQFEDDCSFIGCRLTINNAFKNCKMPNYSICPLDGEFIGWKATWCPAENTFAIVKLLITGERTSCLVGRKCRCSEAKVLDIFGSNGIDRLPEGTLVHSINKTAFTYKVGEIVKEPNYNDNPTKECTNGIHFFMTMKEAKEYTIV